MNLILYQCFSNVCYINMSKICGGGLVAQFCPTRVTPWTIARQVPLSIGFSRQEYWSGLPFPDVPDPGIEPRFPALQADSLPTELPGKYVIVFHPKWVLYISIQPVVRARKRRVVLFSSVFVFLIGYLVM